MYNLEKFELENMLCVIKIRSKKNSFVYVLFFFLITDSKINLE